MQHPHIELVLDAHAETGESPTWCAREQALYWIDVKAPALHRFDPASGATQTWPMPSEIGCFALRAEQPGAIVALRSGLFELDFASGELTQLAPPPYNPELFRFNEGACDGRGRFWLGTMLDPQSEYKGRLLEGALFSYTREEGLVPHHDATLTANGLAWSPDGGTLYFAHSQQRTIFAFTFDLEKGRIGSRQIFDTIHASLGLPDGSAVDEEGCYWVALHGGSRLRRYRPNGTVEREVKLPVSQPTMPAFAGPDLEVIYITSKSAELSGLERLREPHAGGLFRFCPGVRGLPRNHFAG